MKNTIKGVLATLTFSLLLVGCAKDLPIGKYDANEVGKVKKVIPGVIISKRPINIIAKPSEEMPSGSGRSTPGYQYVIKLEDGEIVSIAQDEDLKLKTKQHILVIYGDTTRVVADEN